MPGTTDETKHIQRGWDRVTDQTISILQIREVFEEAVTDRVNFAIRGEGGLDSIAGQLNGQIANINSDDFNTRRCNWDLSVLKKQIIGRQFLPEGRLTKGDANTAPAGEL